MGSGSSDVASASALRSAANEIFQQCVVSLHQGGVATGLGEHGRLSVMIKESTPEVQCRDPVIEHDGRLRAACQDALDGMPASNALNIFGLQSARVVLPLTFTNREVSSARLVTLADLFPGFDRCSISIDIKGGTMLSRWYDIWGAACSVMAMCVKAGQDGGGLVRCTLRSLSLEVMLI